MTVADSVSTMTLHNVHPGGFFWNLARSERDAVVLRLATEAPKLAVITQSIPEAESFAERMTLSGLPVLLATDSSRSQVARAEVSRPKAKSGSNALITTHDFVVSCGPIRVPLAIHLRAPRSVRSYTRRLEAVPAAVHITFVTPEDAAGAASLKAYLRNDRGHQVSEDVDLSEVIDLTDSNSPATAAVSGVRRRFPLRD